MEKIDAHGIFWLHNNENDTLFGHLVFDPEGKGAQVFLVGVFNRYHDLEGSNIRILGWIANEMVTLENCYLSEAQFRGPGPSQSSFHTNKLFIGCHLDGDAVFDRVTFKAHHLSTWAPRTGIKYEEVGTQYKIAFSPPDDDVATFSLGELALGFSWRVTPSLPTSATVENEPSLSIRYREGRPLRHIETDIAHVTSLMSICIGAPVIVDEMILHGKETVAMLDGSSSQIPQPVRLLTAAFNYVPPEDRKVRHHHQFLLSYDELGGVQTGATWLDKAPEFQRALSSLMSIVRTKAIFAENKFMNVTYAAEALHRQIAGRGYQMEPQIFADMLNEYLQHTPDEHRKWLLGRLEHANEPSLTKRLMELARETGSVARTLIGEPKRWAFTIAAIRNDLTHLGSADRGPDGKCLHYLTESVFTIVKVFLLLQVGVSQELLAQKVTSSEVSHYRSGIAESINEARAYLRRHGRL